MQDMSKLFSSNNQMSVLRDEPRDLFYRESSTRIKLYKFFIGAYSLSDLDLYEVQTLCVVFHSF